MSTVTALSLVKDEPRLDEVLLSRVDDLRAKVASGQIRELAYCAIEADGCVSTLVGPSNESFKMLGAMERMKMRFHALNLED